MRLKKRNLLLIGLFLGALTNCNNNNSSINETSSSISSSSENKTSSTTSEETSLIGNESISSNEEISSSKLHVHTYDEDYSYNDIYHFKECKECHEIAFKEMHEFDQGMCTICYYVDENLLSKDLVPMKKYFTNAKYSYDRNDYVYDENDNQVEFNTLLDRQISIFTQDIMYRLSYVYGSDGTTHNRVKDSAFELKKDATNPYTYNSKVATVKSNTILTSLDMSGGNDDLSSALINDVKYFQNSISIVDTKKNCLLSSEALDLSGAIEGRNMRVIKNNDSYLLDYNINTSTQWVFGSWLKDSTYHSFANKRNFNSFKMAMAQIMANEKVVNGAYHVNEYNKLLDKIDNTQINIKYKDALINFIKNYVIGIDLILCDDNYGAILNNTYDSLISKGNLDRINRTTLFNNFNISVNSLRLYKGYSIVLPALVTQALFNSFDILNTNPLYPYLSRNIVEVKDIDEQKIEYANFKSVVLIPSLKIDETPLNAIALIVQTTNKYLDRLDLSDENPFQEITVNATYVINDSILGTDSKKVKLSYDETNQTLVFDVNSFTNGAAFTKYQGSQKDNSNNKLFTNDGGFIVTGNADYDSGSYIKFSFENETKNPFSIYFNGYYE
ncbi:MAG: hypothetical protein SOU19_00205 [Candidatus Caccosoma sp.]|nr:hypothetical protein [Candidatus Caccosoma sp.]